MSTLITSSSQNGNQIKSPKRCHIIAKSCGIEVLNEVVWHGWEPGREYIKKVVLKNVIVKTQKIHYDNPGTTYFSTLFPKPIVLSAGTSFSLPITFRPLEKCEYKDKIQFYTKNGQFEINIKATLPIVDVDFVKELTVPICVAYHFSEKNFELKNIGDESVSVQWDFTEPFEVEPSDGTLQPKASLSFKMIFRPKNAKTYHGCIVCRFGLNFSLCKTMSVDGTGKYSHVVVRIPGRKQDIKENCSGETELNFGPVMVGSSLQKWIELHNISVACVPFKIEHPTGKSRIDTVMDCPIKEGVIPPLMSYRIPMIYSPHIVDTDTVDYFHVKPVDNVTQSVIKCVGVSKGPSLYLNANVVNFMQIDVGETVTKAVELTNSSNVPAIFQFLIDPENSAFWVDNISGTVNSYSTKLIMMKFKPSFPINYHKQLVCLVHNQDPLFVDLIGTCHAETVKPAILKSKHLERYRIHLSHGLAGIPPEFLNEMIADGKLEEDDTGNLKPTEKFVGESTMASESCTSSFDEYFSLKCISSIQRNINHSLVTLDVADINFGRCLNHRDTVEKIVSIANNTKGKILVQWLGDRDKVFTVVPSTMEIPSMTSGTFTVIFTPSKPSKFYGAELECYAYYKSMRDFRLVQDLTHCPPWCLSLFCAGSTFIRDDETYLPRLNVDQTRMVFPAIGLKEHCYKTILLSNTENVPAFYEFPTDPSGVFSVVPYMGLVKEKNHICVFKYKPQKSLLYKYDLFMKINNADKYTMFLQLCGSVESPDILLENSGEIYFKPTCIGLTSSQTYNIRNLSRIPVRYKWNLKASESESVSVSPDSGTILPNESLSQSWFFSPFEIRKFVFKPVLVVWKDDMEYDKENTKYFFIRIIAEGSLGHITVNQSYQDFGDVTIGMSSMRNIILYNDSSCDLHFKLFIEQNTNESEDPDKEDIVLKLSKMEGMISSREKQNIKAGMLPTKRVSYRLAIFYQLLIKNEKLKDSSYCKPQHLCHLLMNGVYPIFTVMDARCYGSASGISKRKIWSLFSLNDLNMYLEADPSEEELRYSLGTRHSTKRTPSVHTRASVRFNFGAAPVNSSLSSVILMFENIGSVPAEWSFLYSEDLRLELDFWTESGDLDETELHEVKVTENKLFTIEPKNVFLEPGESQPVTFTYKHIMIGTDRLPVLLKLARGREILINFIGVTVDLHRKYIHFPANKHRFESLPIGEKFYPKQVYELYNGGATTVHYKVDLTPIQQFQKENFDQPIFECLTPSGEIPPDKTAYMEWRFSPLEAKTYTIDVPISVTYGDTAIITFIGVGYYKTVMGNTAPLKDLTETYDIPAVQTVAVPGQIAGLSQERILLGNIPLFSVKRCIVFVNNWSLDHEVSFEWHITSHADRQYLSVSPISGPLKPRESKLCRITFTALGVPLFYDMNLICEITDKTEMDQYKKKLEAWNEKEERKKVEFTITEKDLTNEKRGCSDTYRSTKTFHSNEPKISNSENDLGYQYSTLPPIKRMTLDDEIAQQKKLKKASKKETLAPPVPPPSFLLHYGLTARTHDIKDFQSNFLKEYSNFYIDRSLGKKVVEKTGEDSQEKIPCSFAEANIISGILCSVLRGLLEDTYFYDALKKVAREPICYFQQLLEKTPQGLPEVALFEERSVAMSKVKEAILAKKSDTSVYVSKQPSLSEASPVPMNERKVRSENSVISSAIFKVKSALMEEVFEEKQNLKKLSEFGTLLENILENSILNIMQEAAAREFRITARPRFIALPKKLSSAEQGMNKAS